MNCRISKTYLYLLFGFASTLSLPAADVGNLLTCPSFESTSMGEWYTNEACSLQLTESKSHTGKRCMEIKKTSKWSGPFHPVPWENDAWYRFSGWFALSPTASAENGVSVTLQIVDDPPWTQKAVRLAPLPLKSSEGWKKLTAEFKIESAQTIQSGNKNNAMIVGTNTSPDAVLYVDDVSLRKIEESERRKWREDTSKEALSSALKRSSLKPALYSLKRLPESRRIPSEFLGVHQPVLGSALKMSPTEFSAYQKEIVRLVDKIGFTLLRGPGGNVASYYMWRYGGLLTAERPEYQRRYGDSPENMPPKLRRKLAHVLKNRDTQSNVYLEDIYVIADDADVPMSFVVNISTQSVDDILAMVRKIKELASGRIRLEMGNELFEPPYKVDFSSAQEYVAAVRPVYRAVKELDSSIQIGVVIPPENADKFIVKSTIQEIYETGENEGINRYMQWTEILADNSDCFDAVIVHPYLNPPVPLQERDSEEIMRTLFAHSANVSKALRADLADTFPGKSVWLTEYGILTWEMFRTKEPGKKARLQLMKAPGAAVVHADMLLRFLHCPNVTVTAKHNLIDGQGFGLVQPAGKNGSYAKLPNYYVYEKIGELFRESPYLHAVQLEKQRSASIRVKWNHISEGPEILRVPVNDIGAYGFGGSDEVDYLVLINRTKDAARVGLRDRRLKKEWEYGGEPFPNFLNNQRHWLAVPSELPTPRTVDQSYRDNVRILPFSMTVLRVN